MPSSQSGATPLAQPRTARSPEPRRSFAQTAVGKRPLPKRSPKELGILRRADLAKPKLESEVPFSAVPPPTPIAASSVEVKGARVSLEAEREPAQVGQTPPPQVSVPIGALELVEQIEVWFRKEHTPVLIVQLNGKLSGPVEIARVGPRRVCVSVSRGRGWSPVDRAKLVRELADRGLRADVH